jgi:hypothetical protein
VYDIATGTPSAAGINAKINANDKVDVDCYDAALRRRHNKEMRDSQDEIKRLEAKLQIYQAQLDYQCDQWYELDLRHQMDKRCISKLTGQISELEDKLQSTRDRLTRLESADRQSGLRKNLRFWEDRANKLESEKGWLEVEVRDLKLSKGNGEELQAQQAITKGFEDKIKDLELQIQSMKDELANANLAKEEAEKRVAEQANTVKTAQSQIIELNQMVSAIKASNAENGKATQEQSEALQRQQAENQAIQGRYKMLVEAAKQARLARDATKKKAQAKIAALQQQLASVQQAKADVDKNGINESEAVQKYNSRIQELEEQVRSLQVSLQTAGQGHLEAMRGLEAQLQDSTSQHRALAAQLQDTQSKHQALEAQLEDFQSQHRALEAQLQDSQSKQRALERELADTKTRKWAAETDLKDQLAANRELQTQLQNSESEKQSLRMEAESMFESIRQQCMAEVKEHRARIEENAQSAVAQKDEELRKLRTELEEARNISNSHKFTVEMQEANLNGAMAELKALRAQMATPQANGNNVHAQQSIGAGEAMEEDTDTNPPPPSTAEKQASQPGPINPDLARVLQELGATAMKSGASASGPPVPYDPASPALPLSPTNPHCGFDINNSPTSRAYKPAQSSAGPSHHAPASGPQARYSPTNPQCGFDINNPPTSRAYKPPQPPAQSSRQSGQADEKDNGKLRYSAAPETPQQRKLATPKPRRRRVVPNGVSCPMPQPLDEFTPELKANKQNIQAESKGPASETMDHDLTEPPSQETDAFANGRRPEEDAPGFNDPSLNEDIEKMYEEPLPPPPKKDDNDELDAEVNRILWGKGAQPSSQPPSLPPSSQQPFLRPSPQPSSQQSSSQQSFLTPSSKPASSQPPPSQQPSFSFGNIPQISEGFYKPVYSTTSVLGQPIVPPSHLNAVSRQQKPAETAQNDGEPDGEQPPADTTENRQALLDAFEDDDDEFASDLDDEPNAAKDRDGDDAMGDNAVSSPATPAQPSQPPVPELKLSTPTLSAIPGLGTFSSPSPSRFGQPPVPTSTFPTSPSFASPSRFGQPPVTASRFSSSPSSAHTAFGDDDDYDENCGQPYVPQRRRAGYPVDDGKKTPKRGIFHTDDGDDVDLDYLDYESDDEAELQRRYEQGRREFEERQKQQQQQQGPQ